MGMDIHAIYAVRKRDNIIPVEDFEPFMSSGFRNRYFFNETMINGVDYESNELPDVLIGKKFFKKEGYYDVVFPTEDEDEDWMFDIRVTNLKAWKDIFEEYNKRAKKGILSLEMFEKLIDIGVVFPERFDPDIIKDEDLEIAIEFIQDIVDEMNEVKVKYDIDNDEDVLFIYGFDW